MSAMEKQCLPPGDPVLVENIVNHLKARGIFDQFRHECLADVDTKPSYQNLSQRVDGYVTKFLSNETWNPDQNKNELRNKLRRQIDESGMLALGVDHVVEQVINPKIYQVFLPKIQEVVEQYLGLREITDENETKSNKKQESSTEIGIKIEKLSFENSELSSSKTVKSTTPDPIADILALSDSSKQKKVSSSVVGQIKAEIKTSDGHTKCEKKQEEEKFVVPSDVKSEVQDQNSESLTIAAHESKSPLDVTLPVNIKKEQKVFESENSLESHKKLQKIDDSKSEVKKNLEDVKMQGLDTSSSEDSSSLSNSSKNSHESSTTKYDTSVKSKAPDSDKIKTKVKISTPLKEGSQKNIPNDLRKLKSKESLENTSFSKPSMEKSTKPLIKTPKTPTKDSIASPHKNLHTSKPAKEDKLIEPGNKLGNSSKIPGSFDRKTNLSKPNSSKKDGNVFRSKNSCEKSEKKVKTKVLEHKRDSSESSDQKSKTSSPYTSACDSSQGSDQETESFAKIYPKERRPLNKSSKDEGHISKKDSHDRSSNKTVPDKHFFKNRPEKGSKKTDDGTKSSSSENKEMTKKGRIAPEKCKESAKIQHSAKFSSQTDSTESSFSTSSTSDSSKEMSTESDSIDESCSSKSDVENKKKIVLKQRKQCQTTNNLPPPPPPPPPSGSIAVGPSTPSPSSEAESSEDESQVEKSNNEDSSDYSESDRITDSNVDFSSEGGAKSSDLNGTNSVSSKNDNEKLCNEVVDIPDVFLQSSSSDEEFSYFSTPEKASSALKGDISDSDVSVSSVHTSDLSSFDDELSSSSCEDAEPVSKRKKITTRVPLREAGKIIPTGTTKKLSSESKKATVSGTEFAHDISSGHNPKTCASVSEELPSSMESKRELRRERKLNPKYASNEYASIFNSRKKIKAIKQLNEATKQHENLCHNSDAGSLKNKHLNRLQIKKRKITGRINARVKADCKNMNSSMSSPLSHTNVNRRDPEQFTKSVTRSAEDNKNIPTKNSMLPSCDFGKDHDTLHLLNEESTQKINSEDDKSESKNSDTIQSSESEGSENECQYTITLKIKKSPKKLSEDKHKTNSTGTDSTHSPTKRCKDITEHNLSSNHKRNKINSNDSSYVENMSNENKPVNKENKNLSSTKVDATQNRKRLHSGSKDRIFAKSMKKDVYLDQKINNNGNLLRKKENVKNKSSSQPSSDRKTNETDMK